MKNKILVRLLPSFLVASPVFLVACAANNDSFLLENLKNSKNQQEVTPIKAAFLTTSQSNSDLDQQIITSLKQFLKHESQVENSPFSLVEKNFFSILENNQANKINEQSIQFIEEFNKIYNSNNVIFLTSDFNLEFLNRWLFEKITTDSKSFFETLAQKNIFVVNPDFNSFNDFVWSKFPETKKNILPITIRSQDINWIIGYTTASYLAQKFPKDPFRRKVSFILDSNNVDETNNLVGFLSGIAEWNNKNANNEVKINNLDSQIILSLNKVDIEEQIRQITTPDDTTYKSEIIFLASPKLYKNVEKQLQKDQKLITNSFDFEAKSFININQKVSSFLNDLLLDIYGNKIGTPKAQIFKERVEGKRIFMHLLNKKQISYRYFDVRLDSELKDLFTNAQKVYSPAKQDESISDVILGANQIEKQNSFIVLKNIVEKIR
ncbi:Uncharacterised protein [Mesomycoplasma conjunctivae]|uniref:Lipoprotein n=1 Tax=Mesomycoplasma conjunctivae (strain ATCC 25834 / NCTC 10147 / HRC/581) TaxID=572263 RepID=C5J6X7_MESCH|nr:hypothetical protein [Mesomycoplasma conjunctivae]CAT05240.1 HYPOTHETICAL PROTEIN MCJ_005410 [Mesomycoplasma conjunctivae]VEU66461.1 Uncharacterised protein [Mesomycoplasma conjunctivae]